MKKIKILLKMGFFLCLPLFILPFCYACNSGTTGNATLSSLQGEVLVKKAGDFDWIKGQVNMALKAGDAIKSATEANAIVTFFDGSTIELKADTQIEITELIKKQPKEIRLKQEIGETISRVKKLVDPASIYEIETLSAVIGVRGSSMLVNVAPDGTTVVQNLEGQISITSLGIEVKIPEGGTGTVTPGEPPVLELSYDDGKYETGVSNGGIKKYGFGVRFEPGSQPFKINEIRILSWIKGTPKDSDNFTVRITDKDLLPLWEKSLPFALFTSNPTWLEIKVPDITIVDTFYVQLYAPTLGQGLGPYIGTDRSTLNEHSEMLSGWEITEWALSIPKEQTNWMIRVRGNNAVKSE